MEENSDMPEAILLAIREVAEAIGFEALAKDAGSVQCTLKSGAVLEAFPTLFGQIQVKINGKAL